MTDKCLSLDELGQIESLPAADPRRQHFDRCPRCRARLASYRDFMEPASPAIGSKPDEADVRLASALDQEIAGLSLHGRASRREGATEGGGSLGRFLQSLWRPAFRPVWAAAIVVLAFFGVRGVRDWQLDQGDRIILRQGSGASAIVVKTQEARFQPDGTVSFSWSPIADADSYRISFFGPELLELQSLDAGAGTSLTISAGVLPDVGGPDEPLFWKVRALRGGDEIASSELRHLNRSP